MTTAEVSAYLRAARGPLDFDRRICELEHIWAEERAQELARGRALMREIEGDKPAPREREDLDIIDMLILGRGPIDEILKEMDAWCSGILTDENGWIVSTPAPPARWRRDG